jgi:hypothetical protein
VADILTIHLLLQSSATALSVSQKEITEEAVSFNSEVKSSYHFFV